MLYFIYNTVADKVVTLVVNLLRFCFVKAELFTYFRDYLLRIFFLNMKLLSNILLIVEACSCVIPVLLASSFISVVFVIIISPFVFDDQSIIEKLLNNP